MVPCLSTTRSSIHRQTFGGSVSKWSGASLGVVYSDGTGYTRDRTPPGGLALHPWGGRCHRCARVFGTLAHALQMPDGPLCLRLRPIGVSPLPRRACGRGVPATLGGALTPARTHTGGWSQRWFDSAFAG